MEEGEMEENDAQKIAKEGEMEEGEMEENDRNE
jgi:hypothetical protein